MEITDQEYRDILVKIIEHDLGCYGEADTLLAIPDVYAPLSCHYHDKVMHEWNGGVKRCVNCGIPAPYHCPDTGLWYCDKHIMIGRCGCHIRDKDGNIIPREA